MLARTQYTHAYFCNLTPEPSLLSDITICRTHTRHRVAHAFAHTFSHSFAHAPAHMHPNTCIQTHASARCANQCPCHTVRAAPATHLPPLLPFSADRRQTWCSAARRSKARLRKCCTFHRSNQHNTHPQRHTGSVRNVCANRTHRRKNARELGVGDWRARSTTHTCPSLHTSAFACVHYFDTAETPWYTHKQDSRGVPRDEEALDGALRCAGSNLAESWVKDVARESGAGRRDETQ